MSMLRPFSHLFILALLWILPDLSQAATSQMTSEDERLIQTTIAPKQTESLCPEPALARVTRHRIATGETLVTIAQRYDLLPATLMGMNPVLQQGTAPVGTEILIPPYNGVQVNVSAGRTWRELADSYGVRADVLFEVNGCSPTPGQVVFVPGVNWSPNPSSSAVIPDNSSILTGYPLPETVSVISGYGWQVDSASGDVVFRSGVVLESSEGTPVLAVGDGTVAFAERQGNYGNLVVINHAQGLQTRYAQLGSITVEVGQTVSTGDIIGTIGVASTSTNTRLHFEVRSNSDLGWVAEDPAHYVRDMRVGD